MLFLKEPIKLHNSCSYKLLFDKIEDRNKKRINQFTKRKTALSTNQKNKERNLLENNFNLNKNEEKDKDIVNIFNLIINGNNNEINIEKKIIENIDNLNINFLGKPSPSLNNYKTNNVETNNNNSNNNTYNNNLLNQKKYSNKNISKYTNNSSLTNENTNSNLDINKEVNISNLEEEKESISNNIHKLNENNEFALKFLSSSNDSFVQLGNNLVTKAKIQKNYFTESYSQALGCGLDNTTSKKFNMNKLNDIEIIKEEKETDTHLKSKKNEIKNNNNDNSNMLFSMRKKIKLLKEKRKSKSLTKELYLINKKDKKNIDEIMITIPNKNKNNEKQTEPVFKKAKTKIQSSSNRNKNQNIISLNKAKNGKKINNYIAKTSFSQKYSEKKMNIINQVNNHNKSFMHTDKRFYDVNNKKEKKVPKKVVNNYRINEKNNIKKYIINAGEHKNINYKGKKMKFICIREKKNNFHNINNSYETSDEESNFFNNEKRCITLIKNRNKVNKINIEYPYPYNKNKNQNLNNNIFTHYKEKKAKKIISINHSRDIIKNSISSNKVKKEKIQSIKLINNNKNDLLFNKLSPKKEKNLINKTSIQSPFTKNKIIKINKPKILINNQNNISYNTNIFKSNKIYKKNISFYKCNDEKIKNEMKAPTCTSNKKNKINRTIFITNYNANENIKGIQSNYTNFSRDLILSKNKNLKKLLNNSANNVNLDKLKENKSYYLYVDINSL